MVAVGTEVLSVHDIDSSTQPCLGVTGQAGRACPVLNQESGTQPGTRDMPFLQANVDATYGSSTAGPGEERLASMVGGRVRIKAPSRRGLPVEIRSVLIRPFTAHNEWLTA